jgi:mRNA-degrading endonuclease RelE of RelBE toxin-antitoxin system
MVPMVSGKSHHKYRVEYSPDTLDHFQFLTRFQQVTVLDMVEKKLPFLPDRESKNRKPMRPNPIAPWELRIGTLRVYYDIMEEPEPVVYIRAIGIKDRNKIRIGNEVITL